MTTRAERVVVLVNGGAGSVDGDEDAQRASIVEAFQAAGAVAEVVVLDPARIAGELRDRWERPDRPDAIVVAGGDGTVGGAAGAAAEVGAVLAVLPLGTFNHFAKDLGMPVTLAEAAAAIVDGSVRSIDLAEVNGRTFVNNSVLGLYPDMVAVRDDIRASRGWGKVRAVPVAGVHVLRRFPMHRLELAGPGYARRHVRTPLVFVGNGVFANEPGGAPARAALAHGVLGLAVARVVSRWGLGKAVARALVSGTEAAADLETVELTEVVVSSRRRHLRVAVDGEVAWMQTPLRYRVRPGALRVLAPVPDDEVAQETED